MYESYADTLESYIIDDVAEEGLFSKLKEKRDKRRLEKEEKRKLAEEKIKLWKDTAPKDVNIVKSIANRIISKAKSNSEWKSLPFKVATQVSDTDEYKIEVHIAIFKDKWCMNEYAENYIPEAEKCFDFICDSIEEAIKNETKLKNDVKVDIIESNIVSIFISV